MQRRGFTIVEVLVVIAVIAVLLGMLLPALASVVMSNHGIVSQSNLKQWGAGTLGYTAVNRDALPWEGYKGAAEMHLNFAEPSWWANAVPPFVAQPPYRELAESSLNGGAPLPHDDRGSIFVDPAAQCPPDAPHVGGRDGDPKPFFFCYVPNLQLNNQFEAESLGLDAHPRVRLASIGRSDATILMLEMRTVQRELPPDDPYFPFGLVRARADWKRLAARHQKGGHLLMADGHVQHVDFEYATTNDAGTRIPDEPDADWNKPSLIWNPRARAVEDPGN